MVQNVIQLGLNNNKTAVKITKSNLKQKISIDKNK